MTLEELMDNITLQGDIRLSVWDSCDDEVAVVELRDIQNLCYYDLRKAGKIFMSNCEVTTVSDWELYEVKYIFCPGDGFLHIELALKEDD